MVVGWSLRLGASIVRTVLEQLLRTGDRLPNVTQSQSGTHSPERSNHEESVGRWVLGVSEGISRSSNRANQLQPKREGHETRAGNSFL